MEQSEKKRLFNCFAPLLGIFFGYIFGWYLYYQLPTEGYTELATRFYSLVFSMVGWAIAVVSQNKKLHCGGTRDRDEDDNSKLMLFNIIIVGFLVIGGISLATKEFVYYAISIVIVLGMLVGEVGWGRPLYIIKL